MAFAYESFIQETKSKLCFNMKENNCIIFVHCVITGNAFFSFKKTFYLITLVKVTSIPKLFEYVYNWGLYGVNMTMLTDRLHGDGDGPYHRVLLQRIKGPSPVAWLRNLSYTQYTPCSEPSRNYTTQLNEIHHPGPLYIHFLYGPF